MKINGINIEQLQAYIQVMGTDSPVGVSTARVRHHWKDAFMVEGVSDRIDEAGMSMIRTHHKMNTDWPVPFSKDKGPTPNHELLLSAIGACVATTFIAKAALKGITIDELYVTTDGMIDLKGMFEVGGAKRPGLTGVKVTLHVRSSASQTEIINLVNTTRNTSPVIDSIVNPVDVEMFVERMEGPMHSPPHTLRSSEEL